MFDKLDAVLKRYEELNELISKPEIIANQTLWQSYVKEQSDLTEKADKYKEYLKVKKNMDECSDIMNNEKDNELKELASEEYKDCQKKIEKLTEELKILLLPQDPNDKKNVVLEIRAGAGGDEAGLFANELMRMYMRYAENMKWKVEVIDMNENELGSLKEGVVLISGKGVYSKLKYESGVHRVQRVPETESQGRVHTSTVTVAVLPEVEDVEVEILDKDIKIDTYRSSGAGGQHVNKTESAIRITHFPTGIVVTSQDERSQIKNRERAMKVLKSKVYDFYQSQSDKQYADNRKNQVGTGDRSERIRTYNFPQGRVTDHRIGLTLYSLPSFMEGDIEAIIEALQIEGQNALLSNQEL